MFKKFLLKKIKEKFPLFTPVVGRVDDRYSVGVNVTCKLNFFTGKSVVDVMGAYTLFTDLTEVDVEREVALLVKKLKKGLNKKRYTESIYKTVWLTSEEFIELEKEECGFCEDEEYYKTIKKKDRYQIKVGEKTTKVKSYEIIK